MFILLSTPCLVLARTDIDLSDLEDRTKVFALLATIGVYGVIMCHRHQGLVCQYTDNVNAILKWILRVAFVLLVLPTVGNFAGFYFDRDVGTTVLGIWSALKAAQGLYVSGVAKGISNNQNKPSAL